MEGLPSLALIVKGGQEEKWGECGEMGWVWLGGRRNTKGDLENSSEPESTLHPQSPGSGVLNGTGQSTVDRVFL